jgi:hypothetical protein
VRSFWNKQQLQSWRCSLLKAILAPSYHLLFPTAHLRYRTRGYTFRLHTCRRLAGKRKIRVTFSSLVELDRLGLSSVLLFASSSCLCCLLQCLEHNIMDSLVGTWRSLVSVLGTDRHELCWPRATLAWRVANFMFYVPAVFPRCTLTAWTQNCTYRIWQKIGNSATFFRPRWELLQVIERWEICDYAA